MDWDVQVVTKDLQIKTVRVYDYNYPSDAQRAALSQTAGDRVISCQAYNKPQEVSTTQSYEKTSSNYDFSNVEFDYSTKGGLLVGYICATIVPTFILWIINPIPAIIFNIFFARWWFTD
jgi:hypothetical protein